MNLVLNFTYESDIIEVPDEIILNLKSIKHKFNKWLYDKDNNHGYWVFQDGKKLGVSFGSDAFVEYLNKFILKDSNEKVRFLKQGIHKYDENLPVIYF